MRWKIDNVKNKEFLDEIVRIVKTLVFEVCPVSEIFKIGTITYNNINISTARRLFFLCPYPKIQKQHDKKIKAYY